MGIPRIILECDECGDMWNTAVTHGLYVYRLSGRFQEIPVKRTGGWCYDCNSLVPVEVLTDEEDLMIQYRSAKVMQKMYFPEYRRNRLYLNMSPKTRANKLFKKFSDRKKFLKTVLEWRQRRTSPPRCLHCESIQVEEWPSVTYAGNGKKVSTGIKHPGCGGSISKEDSDIWLSRRRVRYVYDEEGRKLWEEWE